MIDINLLRSQKDMVAQMMKNRSEDIDLDNILELDVTRRNLIQTVDQLRSKRNTVSKEIKENTLRKSIMENLLSKNRGAL